VVCLRQMHPYRDPPAAEREPERPFEESVLYGALVVIGGLRVVLAVVLGSFGAEATIAAVMLLAGVVGLTRE